MSDVHFRSRALEADFDLLGEIGRGGMGIVYRALHRPTGREVAVKVIRPRYLEDAETVARFEREARNAERLVHPNIVTVHELRRLEDGGIALIMQYVHGGTLKEVVRDSGPLPFHTIERVLRDVAAGLEHAHAQGIIHRDVKPENIFLDEPTGRALLADFGIARSSDHDSSLTLTGVAIGTPAYMSPEQIDGGELDGRSDLYALGLIGWEMLGARRPWEGESLYGVIYRQKHEELPPVESFRPDVPPRMAHAVAWALMKDPRDRPEDVQAFVRQLESDDRLFVTRPRRNQLAPPLPNADPTSTIRFQRPAAAPAPLPYHDEFTDDAPYAAPLPVHEEEPWWRRRAALLAAFVALPVLLVAGAVASGALSSGADDEEPVISVVDQPVTIPIGPMTLDTASGDAVPDTAGEVEPLDEAREAESARASEWHELRALSPPQATPSPREPVREAPPPVAARPAPEPTRTEPATAPPPAQAPPLALTGRADEMSIVAAGGTHSCALSGTGELLCWGGNDRGQLGTDGPRRATPASIASDQRFSMITAGLAHSCALTRGGEAVCWGGNASGQLGIGSTASAAAPARVSGGRTYRSISAGVNHTCAVSRSGEAYCWGANSAGQLGDGTSADRNVPVRLAGGGQFIDISASRTHSCAVNTQQLVYCWGANASGQLGDATLESRAFPAPVTGSARFVMVVTGHAHSCGLATNGEAWCWGDNSGGQLGIGTTAARREPTRVTGDHRFTSLVAGSMHTCGITRAGEAYCWGRNSYGQIGDGSSGDRATPVRVRGGHTFRALNASGAHTCGVSTGGEALCWGYNVEGQLGDGSRSHRTAPVVVGRPTG